MRKLNTEQKKLIKDYYENNPNKGVNQLIDSLILEIENINRYENLIYDIRRYHSDLIENFYLRSKKRMKINL
tara:strand:+ start:3042 stop:3257 length:216 start_codon:yes stop_codon:yes gene_type:complete